LKEIVHEDIVYFSTNKKKAAIHFYYGTSKLKAVYNLKKDHSSAACLQIIYEFIRDFDCPQTLKSDFAKEMSAGASWKRVTARLLTDIRFS